MNNLVILGAGGFAREVYYYINDCMNAMCMPWSTRVHFYDDVTDILSLKTHNVIKAFTDEHAEREFKFLIGVGNPVVKKVLVEKALRAGLTAAPALVHPNAIVHGRVGDGSVICPNVVVTSDVLVGKYVTLNLNSTIGHDANIGDFTNISPGAHISGNCSIGEGVDIGTGAVLREKIVVKDGIVIGAAACVVANCLEKGVYVGVPAKIRVG